MYRARIDPDELADVLSIGGNLVVKYLELLVAELRFIARSGRYRFPFVGLSGVVDSDRDWLTYLNRAKARLTKARKLLMEGVYDEAGEEAWRATIDAINAATTYLWGKAVRSHYAMGQIVDKLKEMGFVDITSEYGNAGSLHHNYYEQFLGKESVRSNINQVERIIKKIEGAIRASIQEETSAITAITRPLLLATVRILMPLIHYARPQKRRIGVSVVQLPIDLFEIKTPAPHTRQDIPQIRKLRAPL